MAIHDAYARLTPYELLLPEPGFADQYFPAIGEEASERGVDAGNPAAFVMLGAVQAALAELREEDAAPQSAHDHAGVLFFAYHLWRTRGAVVLAQQKTLRALVAGEIGLPQAGRNSLWVNDFGGRAGYVQFPQHLVWIEEARNDPPESVDGLFWFGDAQRALHLSLVAGMRSDRPGFAVVPVPPVAFEALPEWATGPAREGGGDFTTTLPGADLDNLLAIRTPAEVFKLAALLLGRIAREQPEVSTPQPVAAAARPRPSALPFATL